LTTRTRPGLIALANIDLLIEYNASRALELLNNPIGLIVDSNVNPIIKEGSIERVQEELLIMKDTASRTRVL
jgi:hypothetical protein